jgi:signal peptidase I
VVIRPADLVSLAELLGQDDRATADRPAAGEQPSQAEPVPNGSGRPARRWRSGWLALLISTAARGLLTVLLGLLLVSLLPAVFGWHPTVVLTGSMRPLLQPGDVVVARPVRIDRLRPGQVLLVEDPDRPGRLRLHRLVRFDDDGGLVLRGDANPGADSSPVAPAAVHGVAVLRVPSIGLPMLWGRQHRLRPLIGLSVLLAGMVLLALIYRPGSRFRPARRRRPRRRNRLSPRGRAGVAVTLAGLLTLQLMHPAPAEAKYVLTTASPANSLTAAQYFSCRQQVLADSPTLYYQLNETSGTTVADSSTAGATGSYTGSGISYGQPGTCDFDGGTAVTLNGSSGYLHRNSQSSAPSTYTFEIWFATTSIRGGWLVGVGSSATGLSVTADRQLYLTNAGQLGFGMLSSNKKKNSLVSSASYNDGQWHLADASFSTGTGMRLYLDGQLVASNTLNSTQSYTGYLRIGYDDLSGWSGAPTSNFLAGSVDEVATYTTVLSAAQISRHYLAGA